MQVPDNRPEAVRKREEQLRSSHRDLTAPEIVPGRNGEALRAIKGFEGITDEMLREREKFTLKGHVGTAADEPKTLRLETMSSDELEGLARAAQAERENRKGESHG